MRIADYQPNYYDDVREFQLIAYIEDRLFEELAIELTQAQDNHYVLTANDRGLAIYEDALGIVAKPEIESLDFRRQRVLNRRQMRAPFNLAFLREKLDKIIGAGNYTLTIDHDKYTMCLEMSVDNAEWFREAGLVIQWMKPANIVYVMMPVVNERIKLKERLYVSSVKYFRAGINRVGDRIVDVKEERELPIT